MHERSVVRHLVSASEDVHVLLHELAVYSWGCVLSLEVESALLRGKTSQRHIRIHQGNRPTDQPTLYPRMPAVVEPHCNSGAGEPLSPSTGGPIFYGTVLYYDTCMRAIRKKNPSRPLSDPDAYMCDPRIWARCAPKIDLLVEAKLPQAPSAPNSSTRSSGAEAEWTSPCMHVLFHTGFRLLFPMFFFFSDICLPTY